MSDDTKPRITSFAFSKEIFNNSSFSSFLFENKDLMNFDLDKNSDKSSPQLNSSTSSQSPVQKPQTQYQYQSGNKPSLIDVNYSKESQNYPMSANIFSQNSQKGYNKYGMASNNYHLNSPVSAPVESQYKQQTSNEQTETSNYYNIINAIKKENLNTINNSSKSLNSVNYNSSYSNSPPLSPLPINVNNQKFYKGSQQSFSAVDLSKPDAVYNEPPKASRSVKEYPISGSASSAYITNKPRSKSIHNVPSTYEDDSFDFINDSITEYSFTQNDNYEGSFTTNGSEKEKKNHSRSLSKSLKRAVSRNSRKSKKSHHRNASSSSRGNASYTSSVKQPDVPPLSYQEINDNALVFKPSSGAISNYGDANNDNSFDFDSMISSDQTRKISLTPNRMNEIQKHQQSSNRLKPKSHERENLVPMNVINNTLGRNRENKYKNMNMIDEYDSDDSIDRLLNEGKPKRKQETLWEFLKNSSPEDVLGKGKNVHNVNNNSTAPVKLTNNTSQTKYIPIKIQYSPFENVENKNSTNNNSNNNNNEDIENNFNNNNLNNGMNYKNNTYNNNNSKMMHVPVQPMVYQKKPLNENKVPISNNTSLPVSKRSTSKSNINRANGPTVPVPPPHGTYAKNSIGKSNSMKLAHTISNIARTPESVSTEDDNWNTPIRPPMMQIHEQPQQMKVSTKPKMVSVGTQWYISDAFLMRKKRVLFRPVDRRNPIAKYMFNHAFVETIYVSNEAFKKRRANAPDYVPDDFLARNFFYYARYPFNVPQMPKREMISRGIETEVVNWVYPERDTNPIAKYMFIVQEGDYPWRDTNPIAKYIYNGWDKKETSLNVINSEYYQYYKSIEDNVSDDMEMEIITEVINKSYNEEQIDTSIEVINDYTDDVESLNNEDKTEINDEAIITNTTQIKKNEDERTTQNIYIQKEKDEIINKLFNKIINYLEDKEEKQKDYNKTQEFAKLLFEENTKLQKELTKLRSELSAERASCESAKEELARYRTLMQTTLLNSN
ncbi:hypothetical protein BCR36DRAFT_395972 [Piromyces finnis]|uniref:Uncharacterized protein n=1 Tax=Piromyces finnis TaxID=1754191 RepID=A0A1Y1VGX8_9FUNG|nr:hypothetical protein BCR36DRAFT_395972 [Piromyces finnis]|eukprot:ORX55400.1 hypothetical protein BCR36DRAFT_395972 [Piromyces finnis]